MIIYQLTRPISYLSIKHHEKWKFDWLIPCILTVITIIVFMFFKNHLNMFGNDGILSQIVSFVEILPGFYIAALAAIATFNRIDIDQLMPEPTPKVKILIRGEKNIINLTRRRFLCMLFSFLVAESIIISLLGIFATSFTPVVKMYFPEIFQDISRYLFVAVFFLLFWQLLTSTMLGLYYLGDKIHQPNPK